jgi:hypothetical protein
MARLATHSARRSVNVATAKTLAIGDQGIVQNVTATAGVITLPATVVGYVFTIRNGGDDSVTVTVSPNASDLIAGNGLTAADDKDVINTLGKFGDEITLVGNGTTGWNILETVGTWTREA